MPLPPVRFSTMKSALRCDEIFAAIKRAKVSTPPPGDTGTMMRIGRSGKLDCARASAARALRPRPPATKRLRTGGSWLASERAALRPYTIAANRKAAIVTQDSRQHRRKSSPWPLRMRFPPSTCRPCAAAMAPPSARSRGGSMPPARTSAFFWWPATASPSKMIEATRQCAIDFFALPVEEKMKVQRPPAKISRGYNWLGDRSVAYSMGQVAPPDIQEAFAFGPERTADLASRVDKTSRANVCAEYLAGTAARFQTHHAGLLRCHAGAGVAGAARHGDGARYRRKLFRRKIRPPGQRHPHHPLSGGGASAARRGNCAPARTPTTAP